MNPRTLVFSVIGFLFGSALIAGAILLWPHGDRAARRASAQFAGALVGHDAPPRGAANFVRGVEGYFGRVSDARVIDARTARRWHARHTSHGLKRRSYKFPVADVLLHTERGAAVLELEFNSHALTHSYETVTGLSELPPRLVPAGALDDADRAALARGLRARGGFTASAAELSDAAGRTDKVTLPPVVTQAEPSSSTDMLHCIQASNGNVEAIQRCATSNRIPSGAVK